MKKSITINVFYDCYNLSGLLLHPCGRYSKYRNIQLLEKHQYTGKIIHYDMLLEATYLSAEQVIPVVEKLCKPILHNSFLLDQDRCSQSWNNDNIQLLIVTEEILVLNELFDFAILQPISQHHMFYTEETYTLVVSKPCTKPVTEAELVQIFSIHHDFSLYCSRFIALQAHRLRCDQSIHSSLDRINFSYVANIDEKIVLIREIINSACEKVKNCSSFLTSISEKDRSNM